MAEDIQFEFEQAISRQEEERTRLLESQGLLRDSENHGQIGSRSRSVVCRHWLRGMCWKGDFCEFLHQYDTGRMPICRQYQKSGRCMDHERGACIFLHEKVDDAPVCVHYFLGFCRAGPRCRKKHQRLDVEHLPPLLPDWYLHLVLANAWSLIPQDLDSETEAVMEDVELTCRELAGSLVTGASESPSRTARQTSSTPDRESMDSAGMHTDISHQGRRQPIDDVLVKRAQENGIPRIEPRAGAQGRVRTFMIKSSELNNILKSIRLGVWATGKQNTRLLEQALSENDHVVLLFSANESGGFQGYARMCSKVIPGLYPALWGNFSSRLGGNFRVQWVKQCKVEFEKFNGLTNPLNDDQPIRKSRDCQEIPLSLAQLICTVLDAEPDEDLLAGSEESRLQRIDHLTFFSLSEAEKSQQEKALGLRDAFECVNKVSETAYTPSDKGGSAAGVKLCQPPPPPRISESMLEAQALLNMPSNAQSALQVARAHPYAPNVTNSTMPKKNLRNLLSYRTY